MEQFRCPICRAPLTRTEAGASCENRHCFDRAKEGYLHLLPANRMNSKLPGDNKEMVASRRAFLEGGYYQLFSDGINQAITAHLRDKQHPVILDAGCGEGYYTARLRKHLAAVGISASIAGLDISKPAVRAAAKRCPDISFAVASIFDIPIPDRSCDCILDVFAPIVPAEFARVLKQEGLLLLAVPSEEHLFGLKEILYDKPYRNEKVDTDYPGFTFLERIPLRDAITLDDSVQIWNLFSMTPYFWKTPAEGAERLRHTTQLTTPIGFDLLLYKRV